MLGRLSAFCLALGWVTSVQAMPAAAIPQPDALIHVKIVCHEDGRCFRQGRRPTARWVYGEGNFSGPYKGPGYYGSPAYRSRWWPF